MREIEEWHAARTVHLSGGLRAYSIEPGVVEIEPITTCHKLPSFKIQKYHDLFPKLKDLRLWIIGAEYVSHRGQVNGNYPPEWRPYHEITRDGWISNDAEVIWSRIAFHAQKEKRWLLADLAARMRHQTRLCGYRLKQVSDAYAQLLHSVAFEKDFEADRVFSSEYCWMVYVATESFLIHACILRDYFAEFVAQFICDEPELFEKLNITTMGALKKHFLDKTASHYEAIEQLKLATSDNGWMKILGDYRNLVVHSAPLELANETIMAKTAELELTPGKKLPLVLVPLPKDPQGAMRLRSTGEYYKNLANNDGYHFPDLSKDIWQGEDAMHYCHGTMGLLAYTALKLSKHSPTKPSEIIITEEEMTEVKITRGS